MLSDDKSGGILLPYRINFKLKHAREDKKDYLGVCLSLSKPHPFFMAGVYGEPGKENKIKFIHDLQVIVGSMKGPWYFWGFESIFQSN